MVFDEPFPFEKIPYSPICSDCRADSARFSLIGLLLLDPVFAANRRKFPIPLLQKADHPNSKLRSIREKVTLPFCSAVRKMDLRTKPSCVSCWTPVIRCWSLKSRISLFSARNASLLFETAVQELTAQSGIAEDQQVWIGFHEGADTLLDEIVYGSKTAKAAALIAPTLNTQHVDDAIIVDGNYQNQSDWINSLSPDMVRQPMLLYTSNGDNIASPYQMTLLYNKFPPTPSSMSAGYIMPAEMMSLFPSPMQVFIRWYQPIIRPSMS